jgi:acyl-CoA thioester hydrolase
VRVWVDRLGRSELSFGLRVMPLDEDVDHATGERVVVRVDPDTKRPVAVDRAFREQLAPFVRLVEGDEK